MAINEAVRAQDGRSWVVQCKVDWGEPATAETFEHDMAGGRRAAAVIVSLLGIFWVALVAWSFAVKDVFVPWQLVLAFVAVLAFFPIRWLLRQPRQIKAETAGDLSGLPAERWVGRVRGWSRSRQETRQTIRLLQARGVPADLDSPLRPVN